MKKSLSFLKVCFLMFGFLMALPANAKDKSYWVFGASRVHSSTPTPWLSNPMSNGFHLGWGTSIAKRFALELGYYDFGEKNLLGGNTGSQHNVAYEVGVRAKYPVLEDAIGYGVSVVGKVAYANTRLLKTAVQAETKWGLSFGGGVQYELNNHWDVRVMLESFNVGILGDSKESLIALEFMYR